MAFETLVERGYPPEIAYFECLHELKMIVDLIQQGGFNYMRYSISDTAEYGDLTRGTRVVDDHVRANMNRVLDDIQSGSFAQEWMAECDEGRHNFLRLRQEARTNRIHEVGPRPPRNDALAQPTGNRVIASFRNDLPSIPSPLM